ncbi:MAG: hypothetical protein ACRC1H_04940 [Caldilineaceae bacterium]
MQLPILPSVPDVQDDTQPRARVRHKQKMEGAGMSKDGVNFSFNVPPPMSPFTNAAMQVLGMPDPKVKR